MIIKDVSQHGVVVPNNIYGNYPLCNLFSSYLAATISYCRFTPQEYNIFTSPRQVRSLVAFGVQQTLIQKISCGLLLTNNRYKGYPLQSGAAHNQVHNLQQERRSINLLRLSECHEVLSREF